MSLSGSQGLKNAGKPLTSADVLAALAGQSLSVGALAVTSGDVTLSATTDINLGNAAGSQIKGGAGSIRLDDIVGSSIAYGSTSLLCDGTSVALTASGGTVVVSGDATSPAVAAFRITPQDAEPTGANVIGNMYVTSAGVLKICTAAGTPGTWVSVGAQ